jgi:peptidoglycan/xylan/chitin deacetylase (PgdA/CDA1 family)
MSSLKIAITVDDLPIHGDKMECCSRLEIVQNFINTFKKFHLPPVIGFANMRTTLTLPEGQEVIEQWDDSGNILGNHTFSHFDLEYVSEGDFISDIEMNEKYLNMMYRFERYFRYPFLSESSSFMKRTLLHEYLCSKGYMNVPVTIDFHDFMWNTALSKCLTHKEGAGVEYLRNTFITAAIQSVEQSASISKRLFSYEINQIMLLHMGVSTSFFLEALISRLLDLGVEFIPIEEALSDPIYKQDFYSPERNGLNFLQQAAAVHEISVRPYAETVRKQVLRYAYNLPSTISI